MLLNNFSFSQHNLQDYVDCPRRFQLKYIQKVAWPAIQSEPVLELERQMNLGIRFHRILHQMYLGLDPLIVVNENDDIELQIWIQNHLEFQKLRNIKNCYPETTLTSSLNGFRIIAKFDLIAVTNDGELLILDWKTSKRKPKRIALQQRLQTRIYPWVLLRSLQKLIPGGGSLPSQISMIYWFADFPGDEEIFNIDKARLNADEEYLSTLISSILSSRDDDFIQTSNERMCRFCPYRSYCERGFEAGNLNEAEEMTVEDLNGFSFSDTEEIQF
jgi:CRISPR/Cas system-associated exonuclease Cas4 (RecB family)